jgi:hypothetical protein
LRRCWSQLQAPHSFLQVSQLRACVCKAPTGDLLQISLELGNPGLLSLHETLQLLAELLQPVLDPAHALLNPAHALLNPAHALLNRVLELLQLVLNRVHLLQQPGRCSPGGWDLLLLEGACCCCRLGRGG